MTVALISGPLSSQMRKLIFFVDDVSNLTILAQLLFVSVVMLIDIHYKSGTPFLPLFAAGINFPF